MQNVILVIHILACIAMTGLVLVQKSEGGALGIGGGGGGMMTGRGAAGALIRGTMLFGGLFFITSLTLTTLATQSDAGRTALERAEDAKNQGDSPTGPVDFLDPTAPLLNDGDSNLSVTPTEPTTSDSATGSTEFTDPSLSVTPDETAPTETPEPIDGSDASESDTPETDGTTPQ